MNTGERNHLDAWKTAVAAAIKAPAYEWDDDQMPAPAPDMYALVAAVRVSAPGNPRSTGDRGVTGWRLVTRFVGTSNREVLWLIEKFAAACENQQLAALNTSPLELETPADPPESTEQGKRRQAEVLWTYTT